MTREQRFRGYRPARTFIDEIQQRLFVGIAAEAARLATRLQQVAPIFPKAVRADLSHDWHLVNPWLGWSACAKCGDALTRDTRRTLCKGPHRIDLRSTQLWH